MICVIIPHFERVELMRETLLSLQRQSSHDWEAVVVDDGSSAECWEQVQQLSTDRIRVLQRSDGLKGPSRCRNLGIQASSAPYIMFLDSDDLLAPDCVRSRLQAAASYPDCDFLVFPATLFRERPGDLGQPWNDMSDRGDDLERFLRSDGPWCVSSSLWTREALRRLGGFNERVMYGDDSDLHIRALLSRMMYRQFAAAPPDVFVRRSNAPRITGSGLNAGMLESRLTRLLEGSRALTSANAPAKLQLIWEGQYFMEGEFLLFNAEQRNVWLKRLLQQWRCEYQMTSGRARRKLVACYLRWSTWWKDRWYLQVRLARRLVLVCLPSVWFTQAASRRSPDSNEDGYAKLI